MDGPKEEVTVTVPVPRNIEERAWRRFLDSEDDDPEKLEQYILDGLRLNLEFELSEELPDDEFLRSKV